jgi:hypothetical protein
MKETFWSKLRELRALRRGCQEQASTTKGSASAVSEFYAGAQQLPQKSLA